MRRSVLTVLAIGLAFVMGHLLTGRQTSVLGQNMGSGFAAVPGARGGQDLTGPYDVDPDWPKPMSQLPNHQNWTWGAVQGIFAESPDRVFIIQRGELPLLRRPQPVALPDVGPSLSFPTGEVPFRNASQGLVASPPGAGGPGADPADPAQAWKGRMGIDARWEHCVVVVNSKRRDHRTMDAVGFDAQAPACDLHQCLRSR